MKKKENYDFEVKSLVVFILTMSANVMGVIFQALAGHLLGDAAEFADLSAVMALFNILVLPTTISSCFITKYTAEYQARSEYGKIKDLLYKATSILSIGVIIFTVVMLLFRYKIAEWLHMDDLQIIVLAIVLAGITLLSAVFTGSLQGMQLFILYGIFGLIGPIFKIVAVVFSAFTYKKIVTILAIWLAGSLVSYVIGGFFLKKNLGKYERENNTIQKKELVEYIFRLFVTNIGLLLMSNIDILLIKHNFDAQAGNYSAALMLGKIVTYFTGAFIIVLFPMVAVEDSNKEENFILLRKSIIYNLILGLGIIIAINIFADICINVLLGKEFISCKNYLLPISSYVLPLSIINLIANYSMAINNTKNMSISLVIGVGMEGIGSFLFENSLVSFIWFISFIMWLLVLENMAYICLNNRKIRK